MSRTLPAGRRIVVSEFAESPAEAIEKFISIQPMAAPDPAELGAGDVIVEIKSASVGWVDLLMTSGQYQHMPSPPYTPGLEYAGIVAWTGSAVDPKRARAGDRIYVDGFLAGPRSVGGYQSYGGFATYAVAPIEAIRQLPKTFSFDQGCNLLGNYETAWHCLIARGQLKAGETVLIHGASGSTGLAAVHVAKLVGARVIATGRSADKLAIVEAQGADHVVRTGNPDGSPGVRRFRDDIKALTNGHGVDVVYDGVGGDISLETLRCVAFGARYLIVGWAATPDVARGKGQRGAPNANMLPTNLMMMKGLSVLGSPTVLSTLHDPSIRAQRIGQIMEWVEAGKLRPYVSHVFELSEFKRAMMAKWTGAVVGGCVLHP
ncbi:MAG: NADPH:quinone oxidoreductase family protein [Deltaproteobacteria bacterium]|nr:NADPH:quinone oxidoreductase family protein [Deltaproteobacteria bacterium]